MQFPTQMHALPQKLASNPMHQQLIKNIGWEDSGEMHLLPKRFCGRCYISLLQCKLPKISKFNGFVSNKVSPAIRNLNTVEAACISCILPCFTISRKPVHNQPRTLGPAVYIPIDPTSTMQMILPRAQEFLQWLEVQFSEVGKGASRDPTIKGLINKYKVLTALRIILTSPIYQALNCREDFGWLERELNDEINHELLEISKTYEEDKEAHSSIIVKNIPYKSSYPVEEKNQSKPSNDELFSQLKPFRQPRSHNIPSIATDTATRINNLDVLNKKTKVPEEAMFPTSFGGHKRHPLKIEMKSVLPVYQSEVERADFQHQSVQKIFHDYYRYLQEYMNRNRAFVCFLMKGN